jgi:putative transposase
MAELFQNKYRIASARLPHWDYGADGGYFITICVNEMRHEFGEIVHDGLAPTPLGEIAGLHWLEIPTRFLYARLDAHVIMPNHMHGILIIDKGAMPHHGTDYEGNAIDVVGDDGNRHGIDGKPNAIDVVGDDGNGHGVETRFIASLHHDPRGGVTGHMNPMLHHNVARIVRWYKGRCAYEMRKVNPAFRWQARFWDRVIRNEAEYERIRNYILNNPAKWQQDRFYMHE